jgi:hypothetical protein
MSAANDDSSKAQDRMLGSVPGAPAAGRGPAPDGGFSRHEYDHPAVGGVHARAERPVQHRRPQHPKRAARHQAHRRGRPKQRRPAR